MIQNAKEGMLIESTSKWRRKFGGGPYRIGMIVRSRFDGSPLSIFMYAKGNNFPHKAWFDSNGNLPGWRERAA